MSTALLTDRYELTMLESALASGLADHRAVFEVFARRLPISSSGRPPAARTMRAAAEATAVSWFSTDRTSVSSSSPSPKQPSTVSTGDPGEYVSPSSYALTSSAS